MLTDRILTSNFITKSNVVSQAEALRDAKAHQVQCHVVDVEPGARDNSDTKNKRQLVSSTAENPAMLCSQQEESFADQQIF